MGNLKALSIALATLLLLCAGAGALWMSVDIAALDFQKLFVGLVFFCIALIAVGVFQSLRISHDAEKIAVHMTEDLLTESHELFSEVYKSSPVPYLLIEVDGQITSANFSTFRLFNTTKEEIVGKNIFSLISGENEQHISLFAAKLKQGLSVNDEEVRITRLDGAERWVLLSLFSFRDASGAQKGLLTLVDMTKQKEIDRAKTEFVSLASHQLRTPIAAMKWNLELLLAKFGTQVSEEAKVYVSKATVSVGRMEALVDDFLNVSRFELGTLVADKIKIDPVAFFDGVLDEHMGRAHDKHISLEKDYAATTTPFLSDAHLLRMIVGNLVSNAIKYSREGSAVRVSVVHTGKSSIITVADSGMGIPQDEQDKLFTKMFRASNAMKDVPDGTGLGLYVVSEAVKVLGGKIAFISAQNIGTTFTVTLPQ